MTLHLPPGLAPYRELVDLFSEDLAATLCPWLARLDSVIGRPATDALQQGEPNGYDGVAPRGDYELLLASEWLWADVDPVEFLRRAAMKEQLFYRRAYEHQREGRSVVAVFDSGPSQLGAPRLAHLALMLVLWRRAVRGGGEFEWGSAAAPGRRYQGVEREALLQLLGARSWAVPTPASLDAWQLETANDVELWWVGTAPKHARYAVDVHDSASHLLVEVAIEGRARRGIELELPSAAVARRLLTDPFVAPRAGAGGVGVSRTGSRVICSSGRTVLAYGLKYPGSQPDEFKALPDEQVLAADFSRGQLTVFTLASDELRIWRGDALEPWRRIRLDQLPMSFDAPEPGTSLLPCCLMGRRRQLATLVDARGRLFELATKPRVLATHVGAFSASTDNIAALCTVHGRAGAVHPKLESWDLADKHTSVGIPYSLSADGAFLSHYGPASFVWAFKNARSSNTTSWLFGYGSGSYHSVELAAGEEVLGVGARELPGVFFSRGHDLCFASAHKKHGVLTFEHPLRSMHLAGDRRTAVVELHGGHWRAIDYKQARVLRGS